MAYDSKSDRIVLFGGLASDIQNNETWVYDFNNNTWKNMYPKNRPSAREDQAMSYDVKSDRIILYGGYDPSPSLLNDTWTYSYYTNNWTNMNPTIKPPAFRFSVLTYDYESDRSILFGGDFSYRVGTWAYDYNNNTWTNMNPSQTPSGRIAPAMSYDSENDLIILFGGTGDSSMLNDTWSYDYNKNIWTNMKPQVNPPRRYTPKMVYDSESKCIILFGGEIHSPYLLNDTWGYDYRQNIWTHLDPSNSPPPRHSHALVYDSEDDLTILFGGWDSNNRINDTWVYNLIGPPPPDINPPHVISTLPQDNSIAIPITTEITVKWNESMNQYSAEKAFSSTPLIKCNWYWMGMDQICEPSQELLFNTSYFITISTVAKDAAMNSMRRSYHYCFTTIRDSTPPYIIDTYPPDKAYIYKISDIIINFNEAMNKTTTEKAISTSSGSITNIRWQNENTTLVLTMVLEEGKTYTMRISKNATDLSSNRMLTDYSFSYTTRNSITIDLMLIIAIVIVFLLPIAVWLLYQNRRKKHD
jgi:hypothetical protein